MVTGVCGIDVGGSGHRVAVAVLDHGRPGLPAVQDRPGGVRVGPDGLDLEDVLAGLPATVTQVARAAGVDQIAATGVGLTGLMTLAEPEPVHTWFAEASRSSCTVLASDAVTTHAGALGGHAGAVIAAGTGVVALGSDLRTVWHKVDGWGHLLGDCGGGAWIGARALQAALAHEDGRDGGSAELALRSRAHFGTPAAAVRDLHTRSDRAGALASFVPQVCAAADQGDPGATAVLTAAGNELARTADAALVGALPDRLAWAGGVLNSSWLVREQFLAALARRRPGVEVAPAAGTSADGALTLAVRAAAGELAPHPPFLTLGDSPAHT